MTKKTNKAPADNIDTPLAKNLAAGLDSFSVLKTKRKSLKENMNALLSLPVCEAEDFNALTSLGLLPCEIDNSALITLALFNLAKAGSVPAIKEIFHLLNESENSNGILEDLIKGIGYDV